MTLQHMLMMTGVLLLAVGTANAEPVNKPQGLRSTAPSTANPSNAPAGTVYPKLEKVYMSISAAKKAAAEGKGADFVKHATSALHFASEACSSAHSPETQTGLKHLDSAIVLARKGQLKDANIQISQVWKYLSMCRK